MNEIYLGRNKIKILREAGILLIASFMLLPSIAVATTTTTPAVNKSNPRIGALDDLLLDEGFEDGVMPPEGWELDSAEPDVTWQITQEEVHSGDYAALCPEAHSPYDQDEWLISPEIDLFNTEDINLIFWANCLTYADSWTVYLYVMIDGEVVEELWDCVEEEDWYDGLWHNKTFNLDDYSGEIIQLAWRSVGIDSRDFYLDQIQVYAGEIPPPPEVEIGDITGGGKLLSGGGVVSGEIKNVGEGDASDVEWSISVTGNGIIRKINESDNGIISTIPAGGSESGELTVGYGLAKVNITVTASEPGGSSDTKSVDGFLFLFYVFIP
jgi:hypothetical protein